MTVNKMPYNKINNMLSKKLITSKRIKNVNYLTFNTRPNYITYTKNTDYIKPLTKPSIYFKLNYKELITLKKRLKSGYLILSTPIGILTDKKAIVCKTGGTVLCYIK